MDILDNIFETVEKAGKLVACDSAEGIKQIAGVDNFEQAFVRIVKGEM